MSIIHTCLNVSDAEELANWYKNELNFEDSWSFVSEDGKTVNKYVKDENGIELQLSDTEGKDKFNQGNSWDHLSISVENVDEAFERIENHGVVQEPKDQPAANSRTAFIKDPDGHTIELVEPLE